MEVSLDPISEEEMGFFLSGVETRQIKMTKDTHSAENLEKINNPPRKPLESSKEFILEEYKHVATEFQAMHEILTKMFNYSLLINAAPITSLAFLVKSGEPINQILKEPIFLIVVGFVFIANFFMAMFIFSGRTQQYVYARAVNLIRRFFADMDPELLRYLYLPTGSARPKFGSMGFLRWSAWGISLLGALWGGLFIWFILPVDCTYCVRSILSTIGFVIYLGLIWILRSSISKGKSHKYPIPLNDLGKD